jgi:TPP-dependent 2-oxoacid decarboxylase
VTSKNVIHHTLKRGLFAQYGNVGGFHADSLRLNSHNVSAAPEKVIHHTLNQSLQTKKPVTSILPCQL